MFCASMSVRQVFRPTYWTLESESAGRWSNEDMDPVPPHARTWGKWDYISYWVSAATNVASFEVASSMLATGLSWQAALPAMAIGYTLLAAIMVLNGSIGSHLRLPFPVIARSSFGFWFSYVVVITRIAVAMTWFGMLSYTGGESVYQMLKAVWPSTANIPNRLNGHITTIGLMTYFLFWIIQFPFMLVSPQRIRYLFTFKSILVPIAWFGLLIWAFVKAPNALSRSNQDYVMSRGSGDSKWAFLGAINTSLGGWLTLCTNIADFTRYAKSEQDQYVQFIVMPAALTLIGFIGIVVTSAGNVLYGRVIWDPLQLIDQWESRPTVFFMAFSFALASLGTNIGANSLSAANDMVSLCPRYINIRRGQVICALIGGWAFCPWEIQASATAFLAFISGYTIAMGPMCSIIAADYWLVHRGKVSIDAFYDPRGIYRYWFGINWRAALTIVVTVAPAIPGFIASRSNTQIDKPVNRIFQFDSVFSFIGAAFIYTMLSLAFPAKETFVKNEESVELRSVEVLETLKL
ncbi:cytosine-purine permease [Mycena floridula]|nr:cytosine-purine permease [Mycena floridula]